MEIQHELIEDNKANEASAGLSTAPVTENPLIHTTETTTSATPPRVTTGPPTTDMEL